MPNPTKEELVQEIETLSARVRDLEEQLAARDAVIGSSAEPGYLFTTRNPHYKGTVYGVRFEGGCGFLPKSRPDAERLARKIVSDFGYTVTEMTAAEFEAMRDAGPTAPADPGRDFAQRVSAPTIRA